MDGGNGDAARPEAFERGIRLLHEGRAAEAIDLLRPLHEQKPEDVEIALNLGGAYVLEQRYDEAAELLERTARKAPDNHNVWVNLAAARLGPLEESNEEQQARAIEAYEKALAANPEVANVHYMLGLIYRSRGDNNRAAAHFTRALEQNPGDRDAQRMLAAIAAEGSGRQGR